jgi:hypothetical protein
LLNHLSVFDFSPTPIAKMARLAVSCAAFAGAVAIVTPASAAGGVALETAAPVPGGFVWDDAAPNSGPLSIVISIADQRAYVYRSAQLIAVASVSTGRPGHNTPTGSFAVLEKAVFHRSNKYSNAPMPYMQRLTWTGIAIHAGMNPGYPASHGCIRLPLAFAKRLFAATQVGGHVTVTIAPVAAVDDQVTYQGQVYRFGVGPAATLAAGATAGN